MNRIAAFVLAATFSSDMPQLGIGGRRPRPTQKGLRRIALPR